MKRLLTLLMSLLLISTTALAQLKADDYGWLSSIRSDHPRLFFTTEDLPQIVNNSLLFESGTLNMMKRRVDRMINKGVEFKDELKDRNSIAQYGYRAADAAMLWVITKDKKYFDCAKMLLEKMTAYYELRVKNNLNVHSNPYTIICTLCTYDWLYNDLGAEERANIGKRLYAATYDLAWHGDGVRAKRKGENVSGPTSSFNGSSTLPWYVGLTFYGEKIDDAMCEQMLRNGYASHQKMTVHRAKMLGKNGGSSSGTIGNGFDNYPFPEYNFIYTFRSATGIDLAPQMSYMLGYVKYFDWIRLPDNKEFGIGDSKHLDNKLPRNIAAHISEIANLLVKSNPDKFDWFAELLQRYDDPNSRNSTMQFMPLLHRYHFVTDGETNVADAKDKQSIRFERLGQIVMRSGVGDKDTYAIFLTERKDNSRQHYDINHFVIYKNGFRALDSGSRPSPGLHTPYYYGRTIAHNCVTIRMEGESVPKSWGKAAPHEDSSLPVPNDGGQRNSKVGKLLKYEEGTDYVYIASDATRCYHSSKAEKVVREFVWIKPDIFVIFDRVESDKAEYTKSWLYHTASQPVMNGKFEFSEVSQGGKSICRTLLPKNAVVKCIGGEGKQFWADGQNWPIPEYKKDDPMAKRMKGLPNNNNPLVGQWRVEVSPKKGATIDNFLHVIQVGNESLQALPETTCKDSKDAVTLTFDYEGKHYSLTFDKTQRSGCEIKITK